MSTNLPDSTNFAVAAGEQTFTFLRPADPDTILNQMSDEEYEKDQFLPYWTEYWPSSQVLLDTLQNFPLPPEAVIAEAGCGLGVLSAWLAFKKFQVVPFDISPAACLYARMNISRIRPRSTAVCADWRTLPFRKNSFDCMIAADVLYESRWINPVLSLCDRYLKKGAFALIADPCRTHWNMFKANAMEYGFTLEIVGEKQINDKKTTVEIVKLAKP